MRKSKDYPFRNLEVVKKKLQDAVELAKTTLHPPQDIITIKGEPNGMYIVEIVKKDGTDFLCILSSGKEKKVLFREEKDRFRTILFLNLVDCRIFVMEKILKLTFLYCRGCQISIRGGSVGPVEFIKCESSNIDIRGDVSTSSLIPIIQVDMSSNLHFYQRSDENVYAVCGCENITGVIVDSTSGQRLKQTSMQTSIFGEQTFLLFSKKEGIAQIRENRILNDIVQHVIFHDQNSDDEEEKVVYEPLSFSPPK